MRLPVLLIAFSFTISLTITACSGSQLQPPTPAPINPPVAPSATNEVATSEVTTEVASSLSPEKLQAKWKTPLLASVLTSGLCKQGQETPNRLAMGILLKIVQDGLDKWTPTSDQADIDTTLRSQVKTIAEAITQDDAKTALGEVCNQAESTLIDIRTRANSDGMSDEEIVKIIEEYQAKLNQ